MKMDRLLSATLLAIGLLLGYFARPSVLEAQPSGFPYGPGDSISITYADGIIRSCVIDTFFGSFVSCKPADPPFASKSRPFVYNLSTTVSVTLVNENTGR
jgi:hypothetical protein